MDFNHHCNLARMKANQMRSALWSLIVAGLASYFVGTFDGAPWWVCALLFAQFVIDFAEALGAEPATPKAPDSRLDELTGCGIAAIEVAWEGSGLSED